MVNTTHDAAPYEERGCQRAITNADALYTAFRKSCKNSDWKPQVQRFEMFYLFELLQIQQELAERTYKLSPSSDFILRERGKERLVSGRHVRDRITGHILCDEVLIPSVRKYLIYDNGASLEGLGVEFARKRLVTHLSRYFRRHGSNDGYILLIDFKKYYDNIRHDVFMEQFSKYVHDEHALWLLKTFIDGSAVDVSYMTDTEYARCMDTLFSSLEYAKLDKSLRTGQKWMHKHLNVGDQVNQIAGVLYPTPIDNYIKVVRGEKYYVRYMDDSYIIHESKEHLKELLAEIIAIADSIGITVNQNKTRICELSDYWRFLQIQYSLTETGRIIRKINPKRITAMRRKMKKLVNKMTAKEFSNWFASWYKSQKRYMSKLQKQSMTELYETLSREECK